MIEVLADGFVLYRKATFALIFPIAGALLLALGIRRRLTWRRWNRRDNDRLLRPLSPSAVAAPGSDERGDLPPRPRSKGTALIIIGGVVLLLGVGHVLSYLAASRVVRAVNLDVGQCITAQDFEQRRITAEPIDCTSTDGTLQLVSKVDADANCPDGTRKGTLYPLLFSDVRTLCFMMNLREGHCYVFGSTYAPADCAAPEANVKVDRRVDGSSDVAGCPPGGRAISYTEPPRAYCLVAP